MFKKLFKSRKSKLSQKSIKDKAIEKTIKKNTPKTTSAIAQKSKSVPQKKLKKPSKSAPKEELKIQPLSKKKTSYEKQITAEGWLRKLKKETSSNSKKK